MDKLLQNKSELFIESDINHFVETQLRAYQEELEEDYRTIPLELIKGLNLKNSSVKILPAEMSLVLVSILNNAMYALYEKSLKDSHFRPKLTVETRYEDAYVAIVINDNGSGISEGERKQLFSPFFTTKPTSKGTGLGLFLSQDIVKTHKGIIAVDTQPEVYTTFTIQLPLADSPA
jgi:signal transduction histidine kinase